MFAFASTGEAQAILSGSTGLAGTYTSYDFNGLPLTSGDAVTTQLDGGLVYFAGAYYGRPSDPVVGDSFLFGSSAVYNYVANQFEAPLMTVQFTMQTTGAAFNFASGLARTTFRAYRGNELVATIDETTGYLIGVSGPNRNDPSLFRWWGFDFTDGLTTFDRITISSIPNPGGAGGTPAQPAGFGLDNLQVRVPVSTTVPEPGTMALTAVGLLVLTSVLRRRTRRGGTS